MRYVAVDDVLAFLHGDLAMQLLIGPPGRQHDPPLTEAARLELLADDFEAMVNSAEILTVAGCPEHGPRPFCAGPCGVKLAGDSWCAEPLTDLPYTRAFKEKRNGGGSS